MIWLKLKKTKQSIGARAPEYRKSTPPPPPIMKAEVIKKSGVKQNVIK